MENQIMINGNAVLVKEYNGERVVTFKDIDTAHERPDGTARRNFNKNKKHFIDGVDFFVRNSYEAKKEFNIIAPNGLMLFTETGYYMLIKSFTDELSWTVQRELVNNYFKKHESDNKDSVLLNHQDGLYINGYFIPINIPFDISAQVKINELSQENAKLYKQNKELKRDVKLLGGELNNPTLEEVEEFAEASGIDLNLARKFFYHYDSLGWISKKISIKSWRSRLKLWALNNADESWR